VRGSRAGAAAEIGSWRRMTTEPAVMGFVGLWPMRALARGSYTAGRPKF
jgi:hypothetical protein